MSASKPDGKNTISSAKADCCSIPQSSTLFCQCCFGIFASCRLQLRQPRVSLSPASFRHRLPRCTGNGKKAAQRFWQPSLAGT
jgi:hypothetical protein